MGSISADGSFTVSCGCVTTVGGITTTLCCGCTGTLSPCCVAAYPATCTNGWFPYFNWPDTIYASFTYPIPCPPLGRDLPVTHGPNTTQNQLALPGIPATIHEPAISSPGVTVFPTFTVRASYPMTRQTNSCTYTFAGDVYLDLGTVITLDCANAIGPCLCGNLTLPNSLACGGHEGNADGSCTYNYDWSGYCYSSTLCPSLCGCTGTGCGRPVFIQWPAAHMRYPSTTPPFFLTSTCSFILTVTE